MNVIEDYNTRQTKLSSGKGGKMQNILDKNYK